METYIDPYLIPYLKRCNKYSIPVKYPTAPGKPCGCIQPPNAHPANSEYCRPFGYQPKRNNPGGLKFYMYDYNYQTQYGIPLTHPGRGWQSYEQTGTYY